MTGKEAIPHSRKKMEGLENGGRGAMCRLTFSSR
jgi:hypothetical protein